MEAAAAFAGMTMSVRFKKPIRAGRGEGGFARIGILMKGGSFRFEKTMHTSPFNFVRCGKERWKEKDFLIIEKMLHTIHQI